MINTLRTTLGALLVFLVSTSQAQDEINALWNDSGPKEFVGVWVYPLSGGCPDLRTKARPLVFATKKDRLNYDVSELWLCFQLPENDRAGPDRCRSGTLHLELDPSSKIYKGNYSFIMDDGKKLEGKFVAQYCPKENK